MKITARASARPALRRVGRMRRRDLLAVFGCATALRPLAGAAQQRRVPTVGVLAVGSPGVQDFWRLFREGMQELGYTEGQSIHYEFRSDEGQVSRLPELAAELVRLNVDVIVTWFTPAAQAAKQATSEIPIVMALVGKSGRNRTCCEPRLARREYHRHGRRGRGTGWQERRAGSRHAAFGAPGRRAGQCT